MEPVFVIFLLCVALGAIVGVMAGLLGIGGGLLVVPALVYLLNCQLGLELSLVMPMAIATSLSTIVLTGLSSAAAHYRLGNLEQALLPRLLSGIVIGALVGAQLVTLIPGGLLKNIFGFLVLLLAAQMYFGAKKVSQKDISSGRLWVIGSGTGVISSLMGIGGGAIMVPALVWFRQDMKKAIGCASISGAVIALIATVSFITLGLGKQGLPFGSLGYVYLPATAGIVMTSVFTTSIGAKLAQRLPVPLLKKIFSAFLVVVGLRMILG